MAGSGQAPRRGIARLLALCAVLFGLFLMHGAPATAAEGCHGAMSATAPMPEGHGVTAAGSAPSPAMPHAGAQNAQHASGASQRGGAMCVSTPARDRTPLPSSGLVAAFVVLAASILASRPLILGRIGRRGPPLPGGRNLLLQVCIART
ncbi:hypothetical protein [Streptomyces fildesensis]|uniref:hypothetical protein n=1 Tax=Streptomyces fildesensis TaxID=375757 RepID=UPI0027DCC389|nr:hypothetical protein [Streptomyces fildesensis]